MILNVGSLIAYVTVVLITCLSQQTITFSSRDKLYAVDTVPFMSSVVKYSNSICIYDVL